MSWARLCSRQALENVGSPCHHLVALLCGIKETSLAATDKEYPAVVALDDLLVAPLLVLLNDFDPGDDIACRLFRDCQAEFRSSLRCTRPQDLCSASLLERAYLWALACLSAKGFLTDLGDRRVSFRCQAVQPGRVFVGTNTTVDPQLRAELEPGTLYFADEGQPGQASHPHGDLFFVQEKVLCLIDVGGTANQLGATQKINHMSKAVNSTRNVVGVVLLPNLDTPPADFQGVEVVYGVRARRLLGGLEQLLTWFGSEE